MATRIIVLGSGVAGASTAYALSLRGAAVTVVDADLVGTATAAGAGIIQPWSGPTTGDFYTAYSAGAAFYPEAIERLGDLGIHRTGYRRTGALVVNADLGKLDAIAARLDDRRSGAPSMGVVSRIDAAEARRLFPPLAEGLGGIYIEGGARVDGRSLRAALLEAATRFGAVLRSGDARILRPGSSGGGNAPGSAAGRAASNTASIEVEVGGDRLAADAVVIATGAWTNRVLEPLGARIPVEPQRGQITHLRVDADTREWPSIHPIASHYLVAFDDSRVVVGATRETGSGFDARVTAAGQQEVLRNALAVAPGLATATVLETRVGLRPLPGRELPFVGELPGVPGVFVNVGFGAAGLTMGPYVGDLLARGILGEVVPELASFALEG